MKSIIITGAGGGIGKITANKFLENGWRVGLVGRRREALAATANDHENALILPCDVTDDIAVDKAFDHAAEHWRRIDALFNNAGVTLPGAPIDEIDVAAFRNLMDINVNGAFIAARAAFRNMRNQDPKGGRIINNGSISAYTPRWGSAGYTASKHAVLGLTKTISLDGRPYNIACSQIDIGNAMTDMAAQMVQGVPQADGSIKEEPVIDVTHVADAVLQMASLPPGVNVQNMTLLATNMPFVGRG